MSNFAKEIASKSGKLVRCLTKDTGNCLSQACKGLVELSIHLLGTTHEYEMLTNFTSDSLKKQFGKLRQANSWKSFNI